MNELPLFPLQSVLFPGMPLRLHIFESRYKELIQRCLDDQLPFGVVLIAKGQETLGPLPEPHDIGTTAQISYLEPLGDGRSNLLAIGGERFRIIEILGGHPYLTARVEYLPLPVLDTQQGVRDASRIRPLVERYLSALSAMDLWREGTFELPQDPIGLAFMAAAALQVPKEKKQSMLEAKNAGHLLRLLKQTLHQEVSLLKILSERGVERMEQTSPLN